MVENSREFVDEFVEEHIGLVFPSVKMLMKKYGFFRDSFLQDDLVSCGTDGLWRAAITYDESKGSTKRGYALGGIHRRVSWKIFDYVKKVVRRPKTLSLDYISSEEDSFEGSWLESEEPSPLENTERKELIEKLALSIESLNPKKNIVIRGIVSGRKIENIVEDLNLLNVRPIGRSSFYHYRTGALRDLQRMMAS